ncbi:MAG TPA: glycosyltransferase family 4 protein, partial [Gammaproteobacteria bacterium]|nr:glycosyltransferase family 4 protein [Gammaproteobacteria bacterium]
MRIAQVAPLFESTPPRYYGGTERIVSYLTEELVGQGHEVTLFASGDSVSRARLIPICRQSLRLDSNCMDQMAHHMLMVEQVFQRIHEFDVIHFHIDYIHFLLCRRYKAVQVSTLHGRLDIPDLFPLYREYRDMPVVSISNAQRLPLPRVNWQGTVHHGLPENLYRFHGEPGSYLAFLGRISPEKGVDRAIEIARRTGIPLRIAAKISHQDREYFEKIIKPMLDNPLVEFIGEISESEKNEFLGKARALLFPINWPEPFGIVMIEAMACGTPVIAWPMGSVPEVMEHGHTGYVVSSIEEAAAAAERAGDINRRRCREIFEQRFTAGRMAREYLRVYERLIGTAQRFDGG